MSLKESVKNSCLRELESEAVTLLTSVRNYRTAQTATAKTTQRIELETILYAIRRINELKDLIK